jgi:antirestriction protein
MSVAKAFYEKLKPIYDKTCQQIDKLKQEAQVIENKRNSCKDYATRQLLIKERNRIENRIFGEYESKKDTLGHYVEKIGELIKTHDHPLTENPPSATL